MDNEKFNIIRKLVEERGVRMWAEDAPEDKVLALSYNADASDEARKLHNESIVIDGCTFYLQTYNWQLQESHPTALNLTVPDVFSSDGGSALHEIASYLEVERRYPEHFINVLKPEDIYEAKRTGKVGIIIGSQNCDFIYGREIPMMVEIYARIGLRIMQIAYSHRSFAAEGCNTGSDAGLTKAGYELIRAMEHSGITVDLSHVGCRSTLEAMDYATKPMIFSHSNPRTMFEHTRNITDEQAKKCAEIGGVIGVCAFPPILWDGENFPTVERYVDAVCYYANLIGTDHIGIGLDSNAEPGGYVRINARNIFGRRPELVNMYEKSYDPKTGNITICTEGIHGMTNHLNIVDKLLKRGFSHDDVRKIMGENFLRVFKATWRK